MQEDVKDLSAALRSQDPAIVTKALAQLLVEQYIATVEIPRFKGDDVPQRAPWADDAVTSVGPASFTSDHEQRKDRLKVTLPPLVDYILNAPKDQSTKQDKDTTLPGRIGASKEMRTEILDVVGDHQFDRQFSDFIAKLGHVKEIANLIARDNIFLDLHKAGLPAPGGIEEVISRKVFPTAKQAVEMFNKPVLGLTLTGHPTNTNSLTSMKAQRALARTIDALRHGKSDLGAVTEAMRIFAKEPLLPQDKNGKTISSLSVSQETAQMLNFLGNMYEDLPHIYERFDAPLKKQFGKTYDPSTLHLPIDLSSWGSSGDKDGNKNVNAVTTLQAALMHYHEAIKHYNEDMRDLNYAELAPWKERLAAEKEMIDEILIEMSDDIEAGQKRYRIEHELKPDEIVPALLAPKDFEKYARALKHHTRGLNPVLFAKDLGKACANNDDQRLRDLARRFEIFGFTFGRIEYRETAEEYTRIVSLLIPGYEKMDEAERQRALTEYLKKPGNQLAADYAETIQELEASAQKPYSEKDARPIAYHTLKRMELARDHQDLITDNVLAECQNTSNFLEALLLQKIVTQNDIAPKMGIVPLFEEYGVLEKVGTILGEAFANPAYRDHVQSLNVRHGKTTQQIQLAHSDNARRAGMPAARAYIYEAHDTIRKVCEEHGINVQFFEGGSQSDPYRGGVRAQSASVNEFGIHDFAKFTYQGGDLLNYLNYASSSIRMVTRAIGHRAEVLFNKLMKREPKKEFDATLDHIAVTALKATVKDYENRVFKNPALGEFLTDLGYMENATASSVTSRSTQRGGSAGVLDVTKTRTIAFSKGFQHAGICPTWIGAQTLLSNLRDQLEGADDPKKLNELYRKSPIFSDVVDRLLFGLAMTDLDALGDTHHGKTREKKMYRALGYEYEEAFGIAMAAKTGKAYDAGSRSFTELRRIVIAEGLPHMKEDFDSKLYYLSTVDALRDAITPIPDKEERLVRSNRLASIEGAEKKFAKEDAERDPNIPLTEQQLRKRADLQASKKVIDELAENERHDRALLVNAADTTLHGRWLRADDPATTLLAEKIKQVANDNRDKPANENLKAAYDLYAKATHARNGNGHTGRAA